jgi:hypothetical protein
LARAASIRDGPAADWLAVLGADSRAETETILPAGRASAVPAPIVNTKTTNAAFKPNRFDIVFSVFSVMG